MKRNNPITPEVYKQIEGHLKELPQLTKLIDGKPQRRAVCEYERTEKITEQDCKILTKPKFVNHLKRSFEPVCVNHKVNLIKEYQSKGQKGIDDYVKTIMDIKAKHDAAEKQKAELAAISPEKELS